MGYVASPPTCGVILIFLVAPLRWGPILWQGLSSQSADLWAIYDLLPHSKVLVIPGWHKLRNQSIYLCNSDFVTRPEALGTPERQLGYVANWLTCGPCVIFSPAPLRWGPLVQQGVCSPSAHLWDT